MARECRIISALFDTGVPVAKTWGLCQDKSVNDADFFVMTCIEGVVLHDAAAAEPMSPEARRRFGEDVAKVLVNLHNLEPSDVGLGDLGRREAYLDRQLKRWTKQWEATKTHDEPDMDACLELLHVRKPEQIGSAIVHGDYRPGNFMHQDGAIAAVFDWELCTLGDPLADVGYMLNNWQQPDDVIEATATSAPPPTSIGGFPTRDEMCDWYQAVAGEIKEPIGMFGSRVEASFHVVVGQVSSIRNIGKIKSLGLSVFSCTSLLDQDCFLLRLSLKLGYFPVIMF